MDTNKQLLLWESKGCAAEGIPTPEELKKTPGFCSLERLRKGPVAVIECTQEIPCNPCEAACHQGAIKVGSPITNLPVLDVDKCTGCGLCISSCPGMAIFVVDVTYSGDKALVSFPYEYLPLPEVGDKVAATDREGKKVCEGEVIRVLDKPKQGHTPVVSVAIPKEFALQVRSIARKEAGAPATKDNLGSEDKRRILTHPILSQQELQKEVAITVDNKKVMAREGEMIIAALLSAGIRVNRFTAKYNQPRGLFCGIGQCTDCMMTVNGTANVRTCVTPVEEGMAIETQYGHGKWVEKIEKK